MDPVVLNTSINATLLQPPQSWWSSNTISTLVTAIVTILAVYLGQRFANNAERDRDFLKARRRAYYKFIEVFSDAGRQKEWTTPSISEKLPIMWKAALEAGEYGDISNMRFETPLDAFLKVEEDSGLAFDLECQLGDFWFHNCKLMKNDEFSPISSCIEIDSFYGLIEFFETLMRIDPAKIKMIFLLKHGQAFIPIFRNILLSEMNRAPWWLFWHKDNGLLFQRMRRGSHKADQGDEEIRITYDNKGNVLLRSRGDLRSQRKSHEVSIEVYDEVIKMNPTNAKAWYAKGVSLKALGRMEEEDAAFAKAKELGYSENVWPCQVQRKGE